jgi:SAM-dependent methyltransferase
LVSDYLVVRRSGRFDSGFYLSAYPDVSAAGMDPLMHYVEHGWRSGYDPNPHFSTRAYLQSRPDVARAGVNPFVHHLRDEGLGQNADTTADTQLNIGAAKTRIPGFVNLDVVPVADISLDFSQARLPFDDDSVDLVFSYHTLEHIPNYLFALSEIHRVLRHEGVLLLGLPYVTLSEYNLVNPFHHHNFSEHSFAFFDPTRLKGSAAESSDISFRTAFTRFHYMRGFRLLPGPCRRWARRHLFNVVSAFDVGLIAVKGTRSVDISSARGEELRETFDRCLSQRKPYPG